MRQTIYYLTHPYNAEGVVPEFQEWHMLQIPDCDDLISLTSSNVDLMHGTRERREHKDAWDNLLLWFPVSLFQMRSSPIPKTDDSGCFI